MHIKNQERACDIICERKRVLVMERFCCGAVQHSLALQVDFSPLEVEMEQKDRQLMFGHFEILTLDL